MTRLYVAGGVICVALACIAGAYYMGKQSAYIKSVEDTAEVLGKAGDVANDVSKMDGSAVLDGLSKWVRD